MAEGTYEYECMRAELLGTEKPEYDEFLKKQKENQAAGVENEEIDIENLKEAEAGNDQFRSAEGKLGELNNLLSVTQKKINNFKYRCSSVTSYMKTRLGNLSSSVSLDGSSVEAIKIKEEDDDSATSTPQKNALETNDISESKNSNPQSNQRKSELTRALDNHVDRLDSMLEMADNAQYNMQHQRKQMQSFLN